MSLKQEWLRVVGQKIRSPVTLGMRKTAPLGYQVGQVQQEVGQEVDHMTNGVIHGGEVFLIPKF